MAKRTTRRGRTSRKNKSRKKRIVRKRMKGGAPDDLDSKPKKYWPKHVRDESRERAKSHSAWRSEYKKELKDMKIKWKKQRALTNPEKLEQLSAACSKLSLGRNRFQKDELFNSRAYDELLSMCGKMSISAHESRGLAEDPADQQVLAVVDEESDDSSDDESDTDSVEVSFGEHDRRI